MASIQTPYQRYQTALSMIRLYRSFLAQKNTADKNMIRHLLCKWERTAAALRLHVLKKRKNRQKSG